MSEPTLVMLVGGPKDGWVYDPKTFKEAPPPLHGFEWGRFEYEDSGLVHEFEDGRQARVFKPVHPAPEEQD